MTGKIEGNIFWDYDLVSDIHMKLRVHPEVLKLNVRELSKVLTKKEKEQLRRSFHDRRKN